jgi:hypothetical protein
MTYAVRGSGLCPCGDEAGAVVELMEIEAERPICTGGQRWSEERTL